MKLADVTAMMTAIAPVIREYTSAAVAPIVSRLDQLDARVGQVSDAVNQVRAAPPTHHPALSDIQVDALVERVLAHVPAPKDGLGLAGAVIDRDGALVITLSDGRQNNLGQVVGKSIDERVLMQRLCGEAADAVEALKKDVARCVHQIAAVALPDVAGMIADAVRALPVPPTLSDVRSLVEQQVQHAVSKMPPARDGIDGRGVKSTLIDGDGVLIITMTDGQIDKVGRVVGRDGADADMSMIERTIADCIKKLPPARDGADGLGFDDLDLEDGDDGVFLAFSRGDETKRFRLPVVADRGVYKALTTYHKGDGVTWGGSYWIARGETSAKPGLDEAWRLAVKKGRDGRDTR